jgi:hypothetical protein
VSNLKNSRLQIHRVATAVCWTTTTEVGQGNNPSTMETGWLPRKRSRQRPLRPQLPGLRPLLGLLAFHLLFLQCSSGWSFVDVTCCLFVVCYTTALQSGAEMCHDSCELHKPSRGFVESLIHAARHFSINLKRN